MEVAVFITSSDERAVNTFLRWLVSKFEQSQWDMDIVSVQDRAPTSGRSVEIKVSWGS